MVARTDATSPAELMTYAVYAYESVYQYALSLHKYGVNPRLRRAEFYETLKNTSYDAVTGWYEYDKNGDRAQKMDVVNFQWKDFEADVTNGIPFTRIASFEKLGANAGVKFHDGKTLMFGGGVTDIAPIAMPSVSEQMPIEVRIMGIFPFSGGWARGRRRTARL